MLTGYTRRLSVYTENNGGLSNSESSEKEIDVKNAFNNAFNFFRERTRIYETEVGRVSVEVSAGYHRV